MSCDTHDRTQRIFYPSLKKKKIWKIFPELSHGQAWTYRWTSGRTGKRTDGYTDEPTDAGNDNFPSASGLKVKKHIIYMGAISKVKTNLIVAHISLVSYYSKRFQYGEYFSDINMLIMGYLSMRYRKTCLEFSAGHVMQEWFVHYIQLIKLWLCSNKSIHPIYSWTFCRDFPTILNEKLARDQVRPSNQVNLTWNVSQYWGLIT